MNQQQQYWQCPQCTRYWQPDRYDCPSCGHRMPASAFKKQNNSWGFFLILGGCAFIVFLVVAAIVLSKFSAPSSRQSTTPGVAEQVTLPATEEAKLRRGVQILEYLHQSYLKYNAEQFRKEVAANESELVALSESLTRGEPKRDLLTNAASAYQSAALLTFKYPKNNKDVQTQIAAGGIRTEMLKRIMSGKLDKNTQAAYDAWMEGRKNDR